MAILISEEEEYTIEELEKLFRSACLGEINIFHDHNRIIARLCNTLLKIKAKNEDEMEKN